MYKISSYFLFLALIGVCAGGTFEDAAFITLDGEGCDTAPEKDIMLDWAKKQLETVYDPPPVVEWNMMDGSTPQRRLEGDNASSRQLNICAPWYCSQNPDVCRMAGCPGRGRRQLRLLQESNDEDLLCESEEDFFNSLLDDAEFKYEMSDYVTDLEEEGWPEGSLCQLEDLWFIINESD